MLSGQESKPYFQAYTTEDGLGGEAINDLLTDRFGYLWSAAYSGLHRFDGYDFVSYPADIAGSCALSHPIATSLLEDRAGNLWIGTRGGLNRLDRSTNCFQRYFFRPGQAGSLPDNDVVDLAQGAGTDIYVLSATSLSQLNSATGQITTVATPGLSPQAIFSIDETLIVAGKAGIRMLTPAPGITVPFANGETPNVTQLSAVADTLLIATDRGLFRWHPGRNTLQRALPAHHQYAQAPIQQLLLIDDELWIATRGEGLGRLNLTDKNFVRYLSAGTANGALLDNHTRALATDGSGNLWIGGYVGLNRLSLRKTAPKVYDQPGGTQQTLVLELGTDHAGGIYFYERWRGLFYSPSLGTAGKTLDFPVNDFLNDRDLNHIYTDRQGITWLLRGNEALYRFDANSARFLAPIRDPSFANHRLNGIAQDFNDETVYWLASSRGLGRLQLSDNTINWLFPPAETSPATGTVLSVVYAAEDGKIWFSYGNYYNDCLGYYDTTSGTFKLLEYLAGDPTRIAGGRVKQLAGHPDGSVWAATSQGLISVNKKDHSAKLITRAGDVPIGIPESVLADERGNIWYSAGDQIGRYTPEEGRLSKLTFPAIRQFSNAAAAKLPDGRLLFGGQGGIVSVRPELPLLKGIYPSIVLNQLSINGNPTLVPDPSTESLSLNPGERSLRLEFSALYFDRPQHINYAYRLNGAAWQPLGTGRSLNFTDLRPGEYLLELRCSDGQANWNPLLRKFHIDVPFFWYETSIARWGFIVLTILLLSYLARFLLHRKLERQAHAQLVELDAFKSRLFTDLTHEFRTPLTLILGPARRLRERASQQQDATLGREARRIDRQGRRLLQLINQLLDLRKLEAGQLKVEGRPIQLAVFFRSLTETFRPEAEARSLRLRFKDQTDQSPGWPGTVVTDPAKQESILQNLLSNAIKFTPEGGEVAVRLSSGLQQWTLEVADTGKGIPAELQ